MNKYLRTFSKFIAILSIVTLVTSQTEVEKEVTQFLGANNILNDCPYNDYDYYVLSVCYGSKK